MTADTVTTIQLLAMLIAIFMVAYEMNDALRPNYRKDCSECAAHKRHAEVAQEELNHAYSHEHGLDCGDKNCPRNS